MHQHPTAFLINPPSLHLETPYIDQVLKSATLFGPLEAAHLLKSQAQCPLAAAAAF